MKKLTTTETFFWTLWCIFSLGSAWFLKILIKKAIIEATNAKEK